MLSILGWTIWCLIASGVFYVIMFVYNNLTYWKRRGVPHGFDLPIIYDIYILFVNRMSFPDMCNLLYNRFPTARYYGSRSINSPLIVIRDPELIREICIKSFDNFTDHQAFVDPTTDPLFGGNVFSLKGQRWKEMRGTLSPSFTANKMKVMLCLVSQCANDFVTYYKKHPEEAKLVDMKDAFTRYTNDVIATAAFGISVNSLEQQNNEFYSHGKKVNSFGNISTLFKMVLSIVAPKISRLFSLTLLPAKTNKFFRDLIADTVKLRDEKGIVRPDMIHLLMQARDSEKIEITVDDMVSQALIFFLAGFDTSSNLMCYIVYELAYNSDIQEKLRDEVDEYLSTGEDVTYDTLSKMKYMDMVISETLRKYPPAPLIDRACTKSFKFPPGLPGYSEYTMDVGTVINIPVYSLHHDPAYFPDPEKFDPQRFSDENKDNINPCVYMPFGLGPRKCIANRFALMETKIIIARLLKEFVIKPSTKTPYPAVFAKNFTILVKDGFWNMLEVRKKND